MYWKDKKCMNEMFNGLLAFLPPRQPGIDGDRNMWILKPSGNFLLDLLVFVLFFFFLLIFHSKIQL